MTSNQYSLPILRTVGFVVPWLGINHLILRQQERIVAAVIVFFFIRLGGDYFFIQGAEIFNPWGISSIVYPLFLLSIFCYLVSLIEKSFFAIGLLYSVAVEIWVVSYCIGLLVWLIVSNIFNVNQTILFTVIYQGLTCSSLAVFLYPALNYNLYQVKGHMLSYVAIVVFPLGYFSFLDTPLWYPDYSDEEEAAGRYYKHDDELLMRQGDMVQAAIDNLDVGVADKLEYYYLGCGGYGPESVFKNEVQYIAKLMEEKFTLPYHSIALINHLDTVDTYPMAIKYTMNKSLEGIADAMNIDQDILLFYLTSHGSKSHRLSVNLDTMQLTGITPDILAQSLDKSGIHWRIIIVSACYSGGFINSLKNEYSIVLTASDANHTSFGCEDERPFTYFGEAVFKDNFSPDKPVLQSFEDAIESVTAKETAEGLTHSNPQLWVGTAIRQHLEEYQQ
jgi:hypothetical protein